MLHYAVSGYTGWSRGTVDRRVGAVSHALVWTVVTSGHAPPRLVMARPQRPIIRSQGSNRLLLGAC